MPPKRKAKSDSTTKTTTTPPKRARNATNKTTKTVPKQVYHSTHVSHRKCRVANSFCFFYSYRAPPKFSIKTCEKWYQKYKDTDDPDENITPEGAQQFFEDLGVSLESVYPILIGWKMKADRMGFFTKKEWMNAMTTLQVDSPERLKAYLLSWSKCIENDNEFKAMYLYTFNFAKTAGQKSMDVDLALALWALLFGSKYQHIPSFIEFVQETKPVKVINKDQWSSLLDFARTVPYDLAGYDSTTSWPVLFDDYATWRSKKAVE
ncbi:hypothetical protein [Absidia glauca]|uniref:Defective in cullin neddylation protein n=1 Tax=Absidia glauca TaxID=4829 RepID=A0A168LPH8_ABSGL|nr:hypothetical protein [Absidia glauca]